MFHFIFVFLHRMHPKNYIQFAHSVFRLALIVSATILVTCMVVAMAVRISSVIDIISSHSYICMLVGASCEV